MPWTLLSTCFLKRTLSLLYCSWLLYIWFILRKHTFTLSQNDSARQQYSYDIWELFSGAVCECLSHSLGLNSFRTSSQVKGDNHWACRVSADWSLISTLSAMEVKAIFFSFAEFPKKAVVQFFPQWSALSGEVKCPCPQYQVAPLQSGSSFYGPGVHSSCTRSQFGDKNSVDATPLWCQGQVAHINPKRNVFVFVRLE